MRRIIDLTVPIEEHWRYGIAFNHVKSHENGDPWQITAFNMQSHWFTHIDAPRHHAADGATLDEFPIEDWCISQALVLDLSHVGDNGAITPELLEQANAPYKDRHFDTLLIRTDRAKKADWNTTQYWDTAPYVTEEGGFWLRDYHPKVVGFDFPQDYEIRNGRFLKPGDTPGRQPLHDSVLVEGKILMLEYITNLWKIGSPVCELIVLPMPTRRADGAQVRAVAVVDD